MSAADQLLRPWRNPGDILFLLLLIGDNTVQQAIAQLFGVYVQPYKRLPRIYVTFVAFSFGWVACALTSLTSAIGDKQLMPPTPDCPTMMANRSWLLGRTLHEYELFLKSQPGEEVAKSSDEQWTWRCAPPDRTCLELGWITIASEFRISTIPGRLWQLGDLRDHRVAFANASSKRGQEGGSTNRSKRPRMSQTKRRLRLPRRIPQHG
ncbi:hypothetical protein AUP68_16747 [Ilyonectria robusta]